MKRKTTTAMAMMMFTLVMRRWVGGQAGKQQRGENQGGGQAQRGASMTVDRADSSCLMKRGLCGRSGASFPPLTRKEQGASFGRSYCLVV